MSKLLFDSTPIQLGLEFPNPDGFEDLSRYVGRNIMRSETGWVILITAPLFDWRLGIWQTDYLFARMGCSALVSDPSPVSINTRLHL